MSKSYRCFFVFFFVWKLKRSFDKALVSRAARLRECPLRELRLYFIHIYFFAMNIYRKNFVGIIQKEKSKLSFPWVFRFLPQSLKSSFRSFYDPLMCLIAVLGVTIFISVKETNTNLFSGILTVRCFSHRG